MAIRRDADRPGGPPSGVGTALVRNSIGPVSACQYNQANPITAPGAITERPLPAGRSSNLVVLSPPVAACHRSPLLVRVTRLLLPPLHLCSFFDFLLFTRAVASQFVVLRPFHLPPPLSFVRLLQCCFCIFVVVVAFCFPVFPRVFLSLSL